MPHRKRVLITGASIAGNTAAWWLGRYGFDVTVMEKAPEFRDGGQNVDIRGEAREVLRMMGLEEAVAANGTGERGTAWVDENNEVIAEFDVDESGGEGFTAELEILRGDLSRLIYEDAKKHAAFEFGDTIDEVVQSDDGAEVRFKSGRTERYDIVIVAEGAGSSTRDRVFEGENDPRWMDITTAYFTIPRGPTDTDVARWYNAPGGRGVMIRPDPKGTSRAFLTLQVDPGGEQDWEPERQKAFLRERFADAGWETDRVLDAMETAPDFAFDVLRQVKMDRWSDGRVILTGDAAWCATPLSGIGTTLAIVGSYILAGELARSDDVIAAAMQYERIMRPFVEEGQGVPKIVPKLLNPQTKVGLSLLRGVLRVVGLPGVKDIAAKLIVRDSKGIDLPRYAAEVSTPVGDLR